MKLKQILEFSGLPLKDRIVTVCDQSNTKSISIKTDEEKIITKENRINDILEYIDKSKDLFDYIEYIDRTRSKSCFYNGHWIDEKSVIEEYSKCSGMMLFDAYIDYNEIFVIPLVYLGLFNIDRLPKSSEICVMHEKMWELYRIDIFSETLREYKCRLEHFHTSMELANYEYVEDIEFELDKLSRIKKLNEINCKTYEDYSKRNG